MSIRGTDFHEPWQRLIVWRSETEAQGEQIFIIKIFLLVSVQPMRNWSSTFSVYTQLYDQPVYTHMINLHNCTHKMCTDKFGQSGGLWFVELFNSRFSIRIDMLALFKNHKSCRAFCFFRWGHKGCTLLWTGWSENTCSTWIYNKKHKFISKPL